MERDVRYFDDKESLCYKSKGEEQLAMLFDREGLAYNYEHALAVVDRGKTKIWYPDFWLKDFGIVVEYFGLNGNQNYDEQAKHKMEVYRQNGIEGLFLKEDCFRGDWPAQILSRIEDILKDRLDRFYNREKYNGYK